LENKRAEQVLPEAGVGAGVLRRWHWPKRCIHMKVIVKTIKERKKSTLNACMESS
jgi:hypothetical protein